MSPSTSPMLEALVTMVGRLASPVDDELPGRDACELRKHLLDRSTAWESYEDRASSSMKSSIVNSCSEVEIELSR